jgi:hypothetical protein
MLLTMMYVQNREQALVMMERYDRDSQYVLVSSVVLDFFLDEHVRYLLDTCLLVECFVVSNDVLD